MHSQPQQHHHHLIDGSALVPLLMAMNITCSHHRRLLSA